MISIYVIGMGGVGKSSITLRFLNNVFVEEYDPTIEDSYQKTIVVDGIDEKVEIVDTAGQEEYDTMRDCWARNGDAFVVVYAIDDRNSFDEVESRIQELKSYKQDAVFPMIIVGNKCDLKNLRQVTFDEGKNLATSWDCPFIETSAKNSENVNTSFYTVIREHRHMETTKRNLVISKRRSNRCNVM